MAPSVRLLAVGKLKTTHWKEAFAHYERRLKPFVRLETTLVKDAPGSLTPEERNNMEGKALLAALSPRDWLICLDQHGQALDSPALAGRLGKLLEDANTRPCFALGGAYGLSSSVLELARLTVSFGPMTFPHELARVMLMEQLFRSMAILQGLPYHH